MKIIIAGAGDVGFHLAELLSFENQDIILIDTNQEVLDYAATHLDVLALRGDSSSMDVLEQANVQQAGLLLAVTTSEKTNMITAILAKRMGAKRTIARVRSGEYLEDDKNEIFKDLGIDALISPQQLAAKEIHRLVAQCSFTDVFEFEDGKINLVGFTINELSPLVNVRIRDLDEMSHGIDLNVIAILRGNHTIMPEGETILRLGDHVYFITKREQITKLEETVGIQRRKVRKVMILGGTQLGLITAKLLEQEYSVTLIEADKERCKELAEQLDSTLIINGRASNIELMEEEGLNNMDAFIALTPNSETNIIASLTAKNHGVFKTIAQVENKEYIHLSQRIGVDTLINKKLIAANNIFRYVRKGRIEAITSMQGVDAEVIEFVVHKKNRLTRTPIAKLHLPSTALIGGVVRGDESLIPDGDFVLQVNDKVIVFALPEAISRLEKLFR
jgi:trk system potassium uptake protein TrkA